MAEQPIRAWAGQEVFRLTLRTYIDFNTYPPSAQAIDFIAEDGTTGQWMASVIIAVDGDIFFDFSSGTPVPAKGTYRLRGNIDLAAGKVYTNPVNWYVGDFDQ